ncbi:MAG TPA: hydroxyisourate hydrolase [Pirellulales bacterium]|jgi:5-hydroxyisourate hydrolase
MNSTSPITSHVLDTSTGKPAAGVEVELARRSDGRLWEVLAHGVTNADGRLPDLLPTGSLTIGVYCLTFATGAYFKRHGIATFYPAVAVEFQITAPADHYHVPLLVSPFGYSTYRGS